MKARFIADIVYVAGSAAVVLTLACALFAFDGFGKRRKG